MQENSIWGLHYIYVMFRGTTNVRERRGDLDGLGTNKCEKIDKEIKGAGSM